MPDIPVAVWFPSGPPEAGDRLVAAATALVVDSKVDVGEEGGTADADNAAGALPDQANLALVASLFGRRPVIDLAWIRLRPWRELLATLVEGPDFRPALDDVVAVRVGGKPGARALLGGWLLDRLDLPADRLTLFPDRHASVVLEGRDGSGRTVRFAVTRRAGVRIVDAVAEVDGGPSHRDVLSLPPSHASWALGEGLGSLNRDRVYESAVRQALRLA